MFNPEKSDGKPLAFALSNAKNDQVEKLLSPKTIVLKNKDDLEKALKEGLPAAWAEELNGMFELNGGTKPVIIIPEGAPEKWQEQQQGLK